ERRQGRTVHRQRPPAREADRVPRGDRRLRDRDVRSDRRVLRQQRRHLAGARHRTRRRLRRRLRVRQPRLDAHRLRPALAGERPRRAELRARPRDQRHARHAPGRRTPDARPALVRRVAQLHRRDQFDGRQPVGTGLPPVRRVRQLRLRRRHRAARERFQRARRSLHARAEHARGRQRIRHRTRPRVVAHDEDPVLIPPPTRSMPVRHALPFRLLAAAALCGIAPAHAASFALWFEADADSRWYDLYVGHFAELSRTAAGSPAPNIMYLTESESDPFAPVAYDESGENLVVFAQGSSWDDVGTLTYSGSGNGTFPITGMTLDIAPFVQSEDASALGVTYVTELSGVTGTITFDGGASDIQAQGTIRFVMDASF